MESNNSYNHFIFFLAVYHEFFFAHLIFLVHQVLAFGTSQTVGVYNIEFLRAFDVGAAAVSLVGSINLGVFLGAGNEHHFSWGMGPPRAWRKISSQGCQELIKELWCYSLLDSKKPIFLEVSSQNDLKLLNGM